MIFSFDYLMQYLNISFYVIIIIVGILFYTRRVAVKYFDSLKVTSVGLTSKYIRKNDTKYLIKNIEKILIKRTTRRFIREVKINFNDKTNTYVNNSFNNLEDFINVLEKYSPKNTFIKTVHEPFDYDHPAFYFFLGLLLSFISVAAVKFFIVLTAEQVQMVCYAISFFAIVMGLYFIIYKPIFKRDEKTNQKTDYLWGGLFIIGGILTLLSIIF